MVDRQCRCWSIGMLTFLIFVVGFFQPVGVPEARAEKLEQTVVVAEPDPGAGPPLIPKGMRKSPWEATGEENVDGWVPFKFRFQVPKEGVASVEFYLAVQPIGQLVETDTFMCLDVDGKVTGLHSEFEKLPLGIQNVVRVKIDQESHPKVLDQIRKGELRCVLQDDTALFGAQMVLNPEDVYAFYKRIANGGFNRMRDREKAESLLPLKAPHQVHDAFMRMMGEGFDIVGKLRWQLLEFGSDHQTYYRIIENLGIGLGDKDHRLVRYFRHRNRVADATGKEREAEIRKAAQLTYTWTTTMIAVVGGAPAGWTIAALNLNMAIAGMMTEDDDSGDAGIAAIRAIWSAIPADDLMVIADAAYATIVDEVMKKKVTSLWDVDLPGKTDFIQLSSAQHALKADLKATVGDAVKQRAVLVKLFQMYHEYLRKYPDVPVERWRRANDQGIEAYWSKEKIEDLRTGHLLVFPEKTSESALAVQLERKERAERLMLAARDRYLAAWYYLGYHPKTPPDWPVEHPGMTKGAPKP